MPIMLIRLVVALLLLGIYPDALNAQVGTVHGSIEAQGVLSTSAAVPFWLRSDQFGSVPLPGRSAGSIGTVHKEYDSAETRLVDWGAGLELRADIGQQTRLTCIEGYVKLRVSIFELKAGRAREIMGLVDTTLSSGAFSISGNALGIPKLQLSIPEYYALPFFGNLFSAKGNFAFGLLGKAPIQYDTLAKQAETYFHQMSLYIRLGKPSWKLKLTGGFNHQAFWGNEKAIFGDAFNLSTLRTYEYVILGKTYQGSKIGNHLGSIDLALDYDFGAIRMMLYRQNFYDEGALYHLANIRDGLNGLSIINNQADNGVLQWHKFLVEFFYSKDQAGYPWSRYTPSGDENYYNNYEYAQGWSYKGLGLGNPFISTRNSTKAGLPDQPKDYFNNNRVVAAYWGMEGSLKSIWFKCRLSYSWNYGTFGTSPYGYSTGRNRVAPQFGLFPEERQFSAYLEMKKEMKHGMVLSVVGGLDQGGLLTNSTGLIASITKTF
jgi:hypothetical protein